jgi:hypothetical protein
MRFPWTVKALLLALVVLLGAFVLDGLTILYDFGHRNEIFEIARRKDDSMSAPAGELLYLGSRIASVAALGLTVLLLAFAVPAMFRRRKWGYLLTATVIVPHVLFTAYGLTQIGWRNQSVLDPNDLSPYYDPAITPGLIRFADIATMPIGFIGATGALALLLLPATRRFYPPAPEPVAAVALS